VRNKKFVYNAKKLQIFIRVYSFSE